ncbi:uncharacterized protein BDV14DRAFT_197933 [Aspergillus stella-maris]|uniref:uncharacterized protein n=1 Tax=Aspergillus stella-maris TaxID=1810926 RepID=UPI003CCD8141
MSSISNIQVPDYMVTGGRGGQFDIGLAHEYATKCHNLGFVPRKFREWPRLRAQTFALTKAPAGREDEQREFVRDVEDAVSGFVKMDGAERTSVERAQEREAIFSRYAALLNFVQIVGGWDSKL